MKKRIFSRVLALFMALSMLTTTVFAASFADLQGAINDSTNSKGEEFTTDSGETRYGYAKNEDSTYGIEAWNSEDGTRNVQLNEEVRYDASKDSTNGNIQKVGIHAGIYGAPNAAIDLNGNDINGTGAPAGQVLFIRGSLTLKDSKATTETVTDENGNETQVYTSGKITGGKNGIAVSYGTLNMEDGTVTKNSGVGVDVLRGTFTMENGSIDNNGNRGVGVGGIEGQNATFTMNGGSICNNRNKGVNVSGANGSGTFIMNGGEITGNVAKNANSIGGGVYANGGTFIMNDGKISGNSADKSGGGVSTNTPSSRIVLNGGEISGNSSKAGGGVSLYGGVLINKGTTIKDNTATTGFGDEIIIRGSNFTNGDRNYIFTYEQGEPIIGEDGEEQPTNIVAITVTNADGETINQSVTTIPLSTGDLGDSQFGVDPTDVRFTVPAGSIVSNYPNAGDEGYVTERGGWLDKDGVFHEAPAPVVPGENEENPSDTDTTPGDATLVPDAMDTLADTGTTIEDEEVPLAGLVSIAQLLEELRQYEGIEDVELPEDFKWIDHDYAQAIYWGLNEALVADAEDDPLDPDEIVTVALLREVLENFVEYRGADLTVTVVGEEDDELVMDLGERLTAFYGELEAALEAKAA